MKEPEEPVVVGKYYMVPCVRVAEPFERLRVGDFLPINGPLHEDKEIIGFPNQHYHVDWRFVSDRKLNPLKKRYPLQIRVYSVLDDDGPVEVKILRKKCQRQMPTFPTHTLMGCKIPFLKKLQDAYKDATLKDGHICPHRGISLKTCPARDGKVVCPGHGLMWDLETKKLVDRYAV